MAHETKNLSVMPVGATSGSGADAVQHVAYLRTPDAAVVVEAANYLNASASRLPKGTIIFAAMVVNGTPVKKDYIVTANTGTVVTIAAATT